MAQGQYSKYVIQGPWRPSGVRQDSLLGHVSFPPLIMENKRIFPEAMHHVEIFQVYGPGPGLGCGFEMEGGFSGEEIKDTPQMHPDGTETVIFIGTDPERPEDLGGEVELWLGLGKEAEKFVFSRPTTVVIPPGLFHTPIYFKKVWRPFLHIVIVDGGDWLHGTFSDEFPPGYEFPPGAIYSHKSKE